MLNWSLPGALLLGLAVLPVIFFYFLRMRFKRQPISSTYLWGKIRKVSGGASQLRRWSILLLILQVAAVLAAVFALAGPIWNTRRLERPGTMFLIDTSASMESRDERPNRLVKACSMVEKEIRRLAPGEPGLIVLCGSEAVILGNPTDNHRQLIAELRHIQAGGSDFDEAAVADTIREWMDRQGRTWNAFLATDGGLTMGGRRIASVFGGALRTIYVGKNGYDFGLSGLRLNENGAGVTVVNGWPTGKTIRVRLERSGKTLARTTLRVPSGVSLQSLNLPSLPLNEGIYTAAIEQKPDALAVDDRVYLAVDSPRRFRILLVTANNPFLQAVFDNPSVELAQARNFPAGGDGTAWDLTIADHVRVPENYQGNLLTFGVLPPGLPLRPGKTLNGVMESVDSAHPLLRFVDWQGIRVAGGRSLQTGGGAQVLATVEGEPAIVAWEKNGRRVVICGTDLWQSDLALSGAFPVFLQNMIRWCVPQGDNPLAYTLTVGHPAVFAESKEWKLADSAGFDLTRQGPIIRIDAVTPGFTQWKMGDRQGVLAANIPFSELLTAPVALGEEKQSPPVNVAFFSRRTPLISIMLLMVILLLTAEWILWRGGWRFRKDGQ